MADKRYQVFISSTFVDLKDERQALIKAVLELDQMPAGMELFPASDDDAWQLIKDVIEASDYYVVILGGRYGSMDEAGLGFTEREYDFASEKGLPVIPLLHENPDNLPRERTETDEATWLKLQSFRSKVESRHTCVYWLDAHDLKAKVIVGLTAAMRRRPALGWVRADQVPTGATIAEVLTLRNRVAELESEARSARRTPPPGTEDLEQGDDTFELPVRFGAREPNDYAQKLYSGKLRPTWNEIFAAVAPSLINEAPDSRLRSSLESFFESKARAEWTDDRNVKGKVLGSFSFQRQDVDTCIVQLRALGLIAESVRPRSVRDTQTYWTLTSYGDNLMTQLRAIRRVPLASGDAIELAQDNAAPLTKKGASTARTRGRRPATSRRSASGVARQT